MKTINTDKAEARKIRDTWVCYLSPIIQGFGTTETEAREDAQSQALDLESAILPNAKDLPRP